MDEVLYGEAADGVFAEALEYLNQKKVLPKELYEELEDEAKAKAFTVSGYTALPFPCSGRCVPSSHSQ